MGLSGWLAGNIIKSDLAVKAAMLLDDGGRVLGHERAEDTLEDDIEGVPMVVTLSRFGLKAFVRVDSEAAKTRVRTKVLRLARVGLGTISR